MSLFYALITILLVLLAFLFIPYGHTLGACKDGEEGEVTADIDMEELERFRQKFPVLDDADTFELM